MLNHQGKGSVLTYFLEKEDESQRRLRMSKEKPELFEQNFNTQYVFPFADDDNNQSLNFRNNNVAFSTNNKLASNFGKLVNTNNQSNFFLSSFVSQTALKNGCAEAHSNIA